MMKLGENGIIGSDEIIESGMLEGYNYFNLAEFKNYNSGTITGPSDSQYTIASPVFSSGWGSGFSIESNKILLPYGCMYRVKM